MKIAIILLQLLIWAPVTATTSETCQAWTSNDCVDSCSLYLAESTIPGGGLGVFTGIDRKIGEKIGYGDVIIPQIDVEYHQYHSKLTDPLLDYVWSGVDLGMQYETADPRFVVAVAPGLDAAINCNFALINVDQGERQYELSALHRSRDPGVGAFTPYQNASTIVIADIPAGGELFKNYGSQWFTSRDDVFPYLPVEENYQKVEQLARTIYWKFWNDVSQEIQKDLWGLLESFPFPSRTLNAIPDNFEELSTLANEGSRAVFQPTGVRFLDELEQRGRCLDRIQPKQSTISQAGRGAFATRFIPRGSLVTATPLLMVQSGDYFHMFEGDWVLKRSPPNTSHIVHNQLLLNYCWTHPSSSLHFCPYGVAFNYINHNKTLANARLQWPKDGEMLFNSTLLNTTPDEFIETPAPGLLWDVIATRDIDEGEEIFLDYGDAWEEAWQRHVHKWRGQDHHYQAAREWNQENHNSVLRTIEEQQSNPYPKNIEFRYFQEISKFGRALTIENAKMLWKFHILGLKCRVVNRDYINNQYMYQVEYLLPNEDDDDSWEMDMDEYAQRDIAEVWELSDFVAREAIKAVDVAYSTDIMLPGTFRHALGFPDSLFPGAWRGYNFFSVKNNSRPANSCPNEVQSS